ncbi:BPSS1780 family membrane protein [Marinicella litoralis]|uniref:Glycerophosphoryl diester phosphodiesterase family protein n=1 Tax=Marinicella litoralis TaxID=644220 RepID=A0A4R6XXH9_9GAMM|nr:BPSS1780 family membrane protein [Marinicella litoralis]TDR22383.1 hypothetical protein C8D91_0871 [Marinicella litoralis]
MNQQTNPPIFSAKNFTWKDGRLWFDAGVKLFKQVKNYWYMLCFILAVLMMMAANISVTFVGFLMVFISPIITVVMMGLCHHMNNESKSSVSSLWAEILTQINLYFVLGIYAMLLSLFFQQVHFQLLAAFNLPAELTETMVQNMSGKESFLRAMLNLVTNLPVALAMAFAPALIMFKHTLPHQAIKFSVLGVLRAWKPFVALGLLFILLFFGVMILATLIISIVMAVMGPASQVMINVIVLFFAITIAGIGLCAQYQAFIEIFKIEKDQTNQDGTEIYTEI